jgi:hypothetical protein
VHATGNSSVVRGLAQETRLRFGTDELTTSSGASITLYYMQYAVRLAVRFKNVKVLFVRLKFGSTLCNMQKLICVSQGKRTRTASCIQTPTVVLTKTVIYPVANCFVYNDVFGNTGGYGRPEVLFLGSRGHPVWLL